MTISLPNLEDLLSLARLEVSNGKLPSYIPLLSQVNPQSLAIAISDLDQELLTAGDIHLTFPLMSAVKPFLFLYLLEVLGEERVFERVDRQASLLPFNTIPDTKPANPMLNCGAIALASLLDSSQSLQDWLNQRSGANLSIDQHMLISVRSVNNRRNLAIAYQLQKLGIINNPEQALATYEEICCLSCNVIDLAKIGTLLIRAEVPNVNKVLEVMTACGMYETSIAFAQEIGLSSKSSVSGALLSIVPNQIAIACYSPALDSVGNSVAGMFLLKQIKDYL
ncbi:MAG: glutaminase A [Pseudanabaena sp.]|nr:MAG: glutaminase A [Pseudanabaena sp.]